ncbi:NAD-dependent epimerase/dehydratase family protein [Klugiella xanthotipulae]|uniref:Nucleoside-diphosphate-sugar epimerase n=1 Tax=Klugiella xanthotipulae TaxID=244735 RepID=A0A543I5N0_9MICO|nr:NAD-dependent epimerase/dehydratase family protein [Klugiella xanthotipulae]TQM65912.1 nucleoside-diphosphate-sugar epimerase [Klugiella xanthotipulae]
MAPHLVLGAGLIGTELTRQLVARGDTITLVTRRGTELPGTAALARDASDADGLIDAAAGAQTIFLCTNPPYADWAAQWPPIFAAAIAAARATGARLVVMGNLYGYGRAEQPMTEHTPFQPAEGKGEIRAEGWRRIRAAQDRGEVRAVEVRASDYVGPYAGATAHLGRDFFAALLASKTARVVGSPTEPHAWSYLPDIAATLIAAADATADSHWGRAWVVPSTTRTRVEIAREINEAYGCAGRVARLPRGLLRAAGLVSGNLREVARSSYQFEAPFLLDSTETERELGVSATPWSEVLAATVASYRTE